MTTSADNPSIKAAALRRIALLTRSKAIISLTKQTVGFGLEARPSTRQAVCVFRALPIP